MKPSANSVTANGNDTAICMDFMTMITTTTNTTKFTTTVLSYY